ncbi:hypothetical protein QEL93_000947 [Pseudomonas putida]|nr:hypothetical protein [Pseudomonas putida]
MRLTDHARAPGNEYHFESSDEYCAPALVERAAKAVATTIRLDAAGQAQLQAIVELEKLRYAFATGDADLKAHGQQIQAIRNTLIQAHGREPFDNGAVEKAFYKALNQAYGYVG